MSIISIMDGVREYGEGFPVSLQVDDCSRRLVIVAKNEGGSNETAIDLVDLLNWLKLANCDIPSDELKLIDGVDLLTG